MSLPVNALSDIELIHYAPIDAGAQAELCRRLSTAEGIEVYDYIAQLETRVSDLEQGEDDAILGCDCGDGTDSADLEQCVNRVWALLKNHAAKEPGELAEAVDKALDEMSEFVTER